MSSSRLPSAAHASSGTWRESGRSAASGEGSRSGGSSTSPASAARATDVSVSVSLQAHCGAVRTDMAAEGGQVDAMQLGTRVLELEVREPILRAPPRVLAQATWSPIVT